MSLSEILSNLTLGNAILGGGGITAIIMTLLQVSKIPVNPWSALARALGRAINADLKSEIEEIRKSVDNNNDKIDTLEEKIMSDKALTRRYRILRFGDEASRGVRHSKEHFRQILSDIEAYEKYCQEHPEFPNNGARLTAQNIKDIYRKQELTNDFE